MYILVPTPKVGVWCVVEVWCIVEVWCDVGVLWRCCVVRSMLCCVVGVICVCDGGSVIWYKSTCGVK